MKSTVTTLLIAAMLLLLPPSLCFATEKSFGLINVPTAKVLLADPSAKVALFDANGVEYRKKQGTIPGATLLPSSANYPASVLPSDKTAKLIFYCANKKCMASHDAAKRAISLGYYDVAVLSDGIAGWQEAGEPVESFRE